MNRRRNKRRTDVFWPGAEKAAHDAIWDLIYEDVTRLMENPQERKELNELAARLYERIAKGFREKLKNLGG